MAFTTEGIVLRTRNYVGPDRLIDLLTPREGTIAVIARGAMRQGSKLAGYLVPFSRVRMMIGRGRHDHCAGVVTMEDFRDLRSDWLHFVLASSLVELVLTVSVPGPASHEEFKLLQKALGLIADQTIPIKQKYMIGRIFLWQLVALAGWKPNLDSCALCQEALPAHDSHVLYEDGKGFICGVHSTDVPLVPTSVVVFLREILTNGDWRTLSHQGTLPTIDKPWLSLTKRFYDDVIGIPLKAIDFFQYV